ncbi:Hypothetical predicted protein [Octopus vulgaris]|uniref:Uncharacterized protein n=1 Tax=Octopus vulgaris TaxID=6645 RepID=A0AA36F872_OCTVU|nr:Hypothetical predicted protein [Octopus vulgaris]
MDGIRNTYNTQPCFTYTHEQHRAEIYKDTHSYIIIAHVYRHLYIYMHPYIHIYLIFPFCHGVVGVISYLACLGHLKPDRAADFFNREEREREKNYVEHWTGTLFAETEKIKGKVDLNNI